MDSLYAQYIKDRENLESIWEEGSFVTYRVLGKELFISDIFVTPNKRKKGLGGKLIHALEVVARSSECEVITANIFLGDQNANSTLSAAMNCGFKVIKSGSDVLLISKDVGGING